MRTTFAALALLSLFAPLAPAVRADDALPAGTEEIQLKEGQVRIISAPNGAQVVCDDPSVVRSEIQDEKFVLIGVHAGKTLCGVRFDGTPRGLYQVTVVAPPPEKK